MTVEEKNESILDTINRSWKAIAALLAAMVIGLAGGRYTNLPQVVENQREMIQANTLRSVRNQQNVELLVSRLDRLICIQLSEQGGRSATACEQGPP